MTLRTSLHRPPLHARRGSQEGFTLAEAAVTIAIVSIVLLQVVRGLQSAKLNAYHTKVKKTAYELGVGLLGEIKAGLYRDELDSGMSGTFADADEPEFLWDVAIGDDVFSDVDDQGRPFDNFADRRERDREREEENDFGDDEDDEIEEPFEKIKVRVIYPVMDEDIENELVLEAWCPWEEIYGVDEEDEFGTGAEGVTGDDEGTGEGDG